MSVSSLLRLAELIRELKDVLDRAVLRIVHAMRTRELDIYGGEDRRKVALYTVAEAARYLQLAPATLRSWVAGRSNPSKDGSGFFAPPIQGPDPADPRLSFINLIESHVLWALRTKHSVPLRAVRAALDFAQEHLAIDQLLISPELKTSAGDLFLERYGQLIDLSRSAQLAMKRLLETYLRRVEWEANLPARLFPFVPGKALEARCPIVIDPHVSFGRPVIRTRGISTAAVVDRIDAGESVRAIAHDYRATEPEIEEALLYERAA